MGFRLLRRRFRLSSGRGPLSLGSVRLSFVEELERSRREGKKDDDQRPIGAVSNERI
jgi:hypothetical protein